MESYEKYTSENSVTVTNKEFYSDSAGFPNDKAFWDFASKLCAEDKLYLLCLDIDLSPSNTRGTGFGDLILRKVFIKMQEYFPIFRMRGTKFNLFVSDDGLAQMQELLDTSNSKYFMLYGEVLKDRYATAENINELLSEGIKKMFATRKDTDAIIGAKGNIPVAIQETATKKFISTMWYATIIFREARPSVRTLTAHIFPTEYKEPMALLETIVVLDDMVNVRVFDGTVVQLPIDGMKINITTRFDNDGSLVVSWFKTIDSANGAIEGDITLHEGNGIPASFGKRIGGSKEIYPIKINSQGLFEYVLFDRNAKSQKSMYVTSGVVQGKEHTYEVHKDSVAITLVKT